MFVAADGSKACDPIVLWRSKKPGYFKNLTNISRPHGVYYLANAKVWMAAEIMQEVLRILDEKMIAFALHRQRTFSSRHSPGRFKKREAGISSQEYHIEAEVLRCWHN